MPDRRESLKIMDHAEEHIAQAITHLNLASGMLKKSVEEEKAKKRKDD